MSIVGYHLIFGMYGFWLPNDPRGSWSTYVGSKRIYHRGGPASKTEEHRSLAKDRHDRIKRVETKWEMARRPVNLRGTQARAVARGFEQWISQKQLHVWACAVMPDHVHLVTNAEVIDEVKIVNQLKGAATRQLVAECIHPFQDQCEKRPKCFVRGHWAVYLDPIDVERAIRYVENNPVEMGMKRQSWSFVRAHPFR